MKSALLLFLSWFFALAPHPGTSITPLSPPKPTAEAATPTPTPKPLSFSQLNSLYGPCARVPVLFYHHIEDLKKAKTEGHAGLTVDVNIFRSQIEYLSGHNYTDISMDQLINFFDHGQALPSKPILATFDDGYADFASDALPTLRQYDIQATMFLPTGLVNNPGYLTWDTINSIQGQGGVLFANHTWSHHQVASTKPEVIASEIDTASRQLEDHGIKSPIVFAYPYGTPSNLAITHLRERGFKLAFTTHPGQIMCKGLRLTLPRTRMGNSPASAYGL